MPCKEHPHPFQTMAKPSCVIISPRWSKRLSVVVWLLLLSSTGIPVLAQLVPDTTAVVVPKPQPIKKRAFSFILDNRYTFIHGDQVQVNGLNIGLKLGNGMRIGMGAYHLQKDLTTKYFYSRRTGQTDSLQPELKLSFLTPNFSYTFYHSRWLELSAPLEAGVGFSSFAVSHSSGREARFRMGTFLPVSAGLTVLFKPTRWVGCSLDAGYRKAWRISDMPANFDGWYYGYRLNIFVGNILADLRQHWNQQK
jgi:hypothetical protein